MLHLRAGTLIDGLAERGVSDAGISISGDKISWVGPWSGLEEKVEPDAVLDLSDCVVIPGLIDSHTHTSLLADGRPYEEVARESDETMLLAGTTNLRRHLLAGVTTARDNGSRNVLGFLLKDAVSRGLIDGPRLLVSGRPVTKPGGHFFWCNGEADTCEDIEAAIALLVGQGADHIKIMASGGGTQGTDPRAATYSLQELQCAVTTAHALERLTTAHCRALESMTRVAEAGIDCMEHAEFLRPDGTMAYDEATADALLRSGMFISPTLSAWHWDTVVRLRRSVEEGSASPDERRRLGELERDVETVLVTFNAMLRDGFGERIVGGTDAGCFDVTFGHIDYTMQLMVAGGMKEMQVIKSCTSVAARALGLEDSVGAIRAGACADLVVLGSDPLQDIAAVNDIRGVCQGGRWVIEPPQAADARTARGQRQGGD